MKSLRLHGLCKTTSIILRHEIHTSHALWGRGGRRMPSYSKYETGTRFQDRLVEEGSREKNLEKFSHLNEIQQEDLDEELDVMHIDASLAAEEREIRKRKDKLDQIITKRRFFAPRKQPAMLTYQERQLVKHLYQQDPVQWNIKMLSESFPATSYGISRILKSKWKATPERAKELDMKVQENWKLLEEERLDADPEVLEHLKRFVNRREVMLEQIKEADLHLPEGKKEPLWNNGELSEILAKYEKDIKKLQKRAADKKLLGDGMSKEEQEKEKEVNPLESLHEQIKRIGFRKNPEEKDSFIFGKMINTYAKETTLDELENKILHKAETRKTLGRVEQAILDKKLGRVIPKEEDVAKTSAEAVKLQGHVEKSLNEASQIRKENYLANVSPPKGKKTAKKKADREEFMENKYPQRRKFDDRYTQVKISDSTSHTGSKVHFATEENVTEVLNNIKKLHASELQNIEMKEVKNELSEEERSDWSNHERNEEKFVEKTSSSPEPQDVQKVVKVVKNEISPEESLRLEKAFYDREVQDIKNTSFWNSHRSSHEKAVAESLKPNNDRLASLSSIVSRVPSTPVFNASQYPERIKIPKNQRGSGLTFRIKDCYYDDDGLFLYRVPGMVK